MFKSIGQFTYRHAKITIILTAIFVVIGASFGFQAFGKLQGDGFDDPKSASTIASNLITKNFPTSTNLLVLMEAKHGTVDSPNVRDEGLAATRQLTANKRLTNLSSYWQTKAGSLRSKDGRYGLIVAHISGKKTSSEANRIAKSLGKGSATVITVGGSAAADNAINGEVGKSLGIAEGIAVPLTLIFLVVAFGTIMSAILPIIMAFVAIMLTFAELYILGSVTDVSIYAINLTTALGLGLAVDYALFMVSRYREELHNGADIEIAIKTTVQTAGRTIVFSATAVAAALAAMAIFPLYFLRSFAYAGIGVVIISALTALLVLPSLLRLLGTRIEKGRMPWADRVRTVETPLWKHIASFVIRRPVVTLPVIILFLFLALPLKHIAFGTTDDRVLPASNSVRHVNDVLRTTFNTDPNSSMAVAVKGQNHAAAAKTVAMELSKLSGVEAVSGSGPIYADGRVIGSQPARVSNDITLLSIQSDLDPQAAPAATLVRQIRQTAGPDGTQLYLKSTAAELMDTKHAIGSHLGLSIAIIAVTTFVVLFLFTGSIIQPLRALVTNCLTLAATFGVMVWIFQEGHLASLLHFTALPVNITIPVLLFCIAFGLSMDYEVFLLSRIKEQHDHGAPNDEAVSHGLARAGRIVSTAAIMLAVSFFAFGAATISFLQLFGIGTGLAILLDATLVRGVLVPVFMHLTGDAAWYAPKPLRKLHEAIGQSEQ